MEVPKPGRSHDAERSYDTALAGTQHTPLTLLHLPNELLDAIVTFLDQSALCSFALTCKKTELSASEALYATYTNRDAPSKAPFHLFLRTLCNNPEVAFMVKELDVRGWRSEFEVATGLAWSGVTQAREEDKIRSSRSGPVFVSTTKPAATKSKALSLFEDTAVRIGLLPVCDDPSVPPLKKTVVVGSTLRTDEDFLRLLRQGVEDAQFVLILALLPNLARLHVDGMSIYPTLDWHYCLRNSGTALRALHDLKIQGQSTSCGSVFHNATMNFLSLAPDLERLNISHVNVENSRPVKNFMSNKKLRGFVATHSRVDLKTLQAMLSGHKLVKFCYKPAVGEIHAHEKEIFAEDHVIDRLKDSQHSLQELTLYSTTPSKAPLLSQFDKLDFLEMPFQPGFLGQDQQYIVSLLRKRIPTTLSVLTLRYVTPSDNVPNMMRILADLKHQGEFPELKVVRVNFCRCSRDPWFPPVPYPDFIPKALETFGEMLEKVGIQLELAQTD
ncbi:hypothetical protein OPT61_g4361 [Boeremia exigua]|uniref:Uncharacterized protein n=1 Tax=Boeremia exigua TaxID=749465 RepID=A0ACC2IEL6_9PLEO|nr:hypothetical protein OPT61_g4361 [Boeremia exigua]